MEVFGKNTGLLFNHFMHIMLSAMGHAKPESLSAVFVTALQIAKNDKNITHDHQVFRELRKGSFSPDKLNTRYQLNWEFNEQELLHGHNAVGAFTCAQGLINGIRKSLSSSDTRLIRFCDFVDSILKQESSTMKSIKSSKDEDEANELLRQWLTLDERFSIQSIQKNPEMQCQYLVGISLFWASLFELYLELEHKTDKYSSLHKLLPEKKDGQLVFSSDVFLSLVKKRWGVETSGESANSWTPLYKGIARKRLSDPVLTPNNGVKSKDSLQLLDPDITRIKKRFTRWRNATNVIRYDNFLSHIAILQLPYAEAARHPQSHWYFLINLFSLVQKQLVDLGCDTSLISAEFQKYTLLKERVVKQYKDFSKGKD